jgi:hypothetical protein
MAWSPPALERRSGSLQRTGDYAARRFHHLCDGAPQIRKLGFPVFSRGAYAQDQRLRGRVIDFRCTVEFRNGACVPPAT